MLAAHFVILCCKEVSKFTVHSVMFNDTVKSLPNTFQQQQQQQQQQKSICVIYL